MRCHSTIPTFLTAATLALLTCLPASAGERRDYIWFLRQIKDLDRLPYLEEGVISRQFSSYNRASYYDREKRACVGMETNGDSGHRLSIHFGAEAGQQLKAFAIPADTPSYPFGDLKWVLDPLERNHVFFLPQEGVTSPKARPPENIVACIPGPGCIYRIWSANPQGKVRFYFDGSTEPLELDFKHLFEGGAIDPAPEVVARRRQWPFIRPMTFRRQGDSDHLASDCYLPIPFARCCVVTLTQPAFYQFGYKTFPADTEVQTFHLPLTETEDAVLGEVCEAFLSRGMDPKPDRPGTQKIEKVVQLPPGEDVVLADLKGAGIIQAVHAKLEGNERYAHSKVLLTGTFDQEPKPCIWSPLVNFFGTGFEPRDYKSYPLGYVGGEGYCYFPMPFRNRARLIVRNEGQKPATLSYRIVHAPVDELPANTMHFKCKYRREEVCPTFDYPFLQCEGKGRFVGAALAIDDAWRSWWGEGDEKIWVDDDVFPSFFGTGSEDFFGDAWGIRTLQETFFACSFVDHNREHARTCCYRWMVPDDVPFHKRFRATIENYSESIWRTSAVEWDEDYVSTAYWYQLPGGTDFFAPVPVEKRRPWGKVPQPPVVEAEDVLSGQLANRAKVIDDESLDSELSRGRAIDLGVRKAGEELTFQGPELLLEGPYTVNVHTPARVQDPATFELRSGEQVLGRTPSKYGAGDVAPVGIGVFPKGRSELTIRFTSTGRAVFDCFQLSPARQLRDVFEAEQARIISPATPKPTEQVGVLWSGGRQLYLNAGNTGDVFEIEAQVPAGRWALCVGQTRGPGMGDFQVFVGEKPTVLLKGYAPKTGVLDWVKVGKIQSSKGAVRLRFVCAGKDPKATGFGLGLDYIGWQRIVVEDSIEGENAPTTDVRGGRFVEQRLGPRFSGGAHLWFHPSKPDGSFVWLLDVPKDGSYELCVYFTKSWDYAIVRLTLDGQKLGDFDTYSPRVTWGGPTRLGRFQLSEGQHRLKFQVVGKNEKSKGILLGVDCITLK